MAPNVGGFRGFQFDAERFKAEARRRGYGTLESIADAARVSVRTVRRTISGEELPSALILLWLTEVGIDARKVWVPTEQALSA